MPDPDPPVLPLILAGRAVTTDDVREVRDPYDVVVVGRACHADASHLEEALAAAESVRERLAQTPGYVRRDTLLGVLHQVEARAEELAQLCRVEAGKPITAARGEAARLCDTLRAAAEEATRITGAGEVLALDVSASAAGYRGMVKRVPVGPCAFITPFNFPLNLVAHKAAPAIAAGCPFVLKPAPATPGCALAFGSILVESAEEAGYPTEAISVLPMDVDVADRLVTDERPRLLSFTGSAKVGWQLKAKAGKKKVTLELGGNAACVVDEGADLDDVMAKLIPGAFGYAGQSCISVQRLLVHTSAYEQLKGTLVKKAQALIAGDPRAESTVVGPVINGEAGSRIRQWIAEAVDGGARVLCGESGEAKNGNRVDATVLGNVPHDAKLWTEEVFGPVVVLEAFGDFDDALRRVNDGAYGLQAGVFTPTLDHAMRAWDTLEVGGVVINQVPSWRVDPMPYGGVKASGLGREGVRYAVEDMTEPRLLVIAS